MRKFLLLIFSMMFFLPLAFGQENYKEGYIISSQGHTIHGFINYKNWGLNPNKIEFKRTLNGKKITYRPLNIHAFFVQGEYYLSAVVEDETSTRSQLNFVSGSAKISTRTDTTFLRQLTYGHPGLLFYKNDMNIENFYISENGKLHLLEYKKYIRQHAEGSLNTNSYLEENKKFVGQLMVYLDACPQIRSQISYAQYNRQSLIKLFQNYYKCMHENVTHVQKVEKTKVKFGIVAGVMSSNVNFSGSDLPGSGIGFSPSQAFTGGMIVDVVMPRNLNEWSIHNEISYTSFMVNGSSSNYNMKFGCSEVTLTDLARYAYPFGKVSVFANAGISGGVVLKYTNQIKYTHAVVGEYQYAFPPGGLRSWNFAWVAGVGLDYKNVALEVRENWRIGFSSYADKGLKVNQMEFLVEYTL